MRSNAVSIDTDEIRDRFRKEHQAKRWCLRTMLIMREVRYWSDVVVIKKKDARTHNKKAQKYIAGKNLLKKGPTGRCALPCLRCMM